MRHGGNVWDALAPGEWLDFSANLRPEGTPEWVRAVMARALDDARFYPDRQMRAARRGLAAYAGVDESCILPTAGGAQAIDLVLGDGSGRVLLEQPTFGEYAERAACHGRPIAPAGEALRPGDTLVCCNPNNPTGALRTPEQMLALAAKARAAGAEVMADEAFIDYCEAGSVRAFAAPELTVVGSLTKILAIPGVRLGYVCAAPERIRRLEQRMLTWSLNVLAGAVAAALPDHLAQMREDAQRSRTRREKMRRELETLCAQVLPSEANFLLCRFDRDAGPMADWLRGEKILVRTCASFGLDGRWLRLAVRTEEDNARLIGAIRQWKERETDAR